MSEDVAVTLNLHPDAPGGHSVNLRDQKAPAWLLGVLWGQLIGCQRKETSVWWCCRSVHTEIRKYFTIFKKILQLVTQKGIKFVPLKVIHTQSHILIWKNIINMCVANCSHFLSWSKTFPFPEHHQKADTDECFCYTQHCGCTSEKNKRKQFQPLCTVFSPFDDSVFSRLETKNKTER